MKKLLLTLFFVLTSLFITTESFAAYRGSSFSTGENGWVVYPQAIYFNFTQTQGTTTNNVSRYLLDGSIGYHTNMLYFGAQYDYDLQQTTTNGSPTSNEVYRAYGAQIGVMLDELVFLFTYYFTSTATHSNVDYTGGSGYQVTFGYHFPITTNFRLGPQFIYKSLTYTSLASGGSLGSNYTFTSLVPEVGFRFTF